MLNGYTSRSRFLERRFAPQDSCSSGHYSSVSYSNDPSQSYPSEKRKAQNIISRKHRAIVPRSFPAGMYPIGMRFRTVPRLTMLRCQFFSIVPGMIEITVILMRLAAPPTFDFVSGTCANRISFHPLILVACLVSVTGMSIRLWCYRTLGKLFTSELALLSKHKLVTSGPYAIVRHPAYTGGILAMGGASLANAASGSWARECGFVFSGWGVAWSLLFLVPSSVMVERCAREDDVLHTAFGEEWEAWSRKVRWRLVPWIY